MAKAHECWDFVASAFYRLELAGAPAGCQVYDAWCTTVRQGRDVYRAVTNEAGLLHDFLDRDDIERATERLLPLVAWLEKAAS